MPGFYTPSRPPLRTVERSDYFNSFSSSSLGGETSGWQVTDNHETRKRSRYGGFDTSTSQQLPNHHWAGNALEQSRLTDATSPLPLAHDRYELANGGLTEPHIFGRQQDNYDDYHQLQNQRGMWSIPPTPQASLAQLATADQVQTTPNGTKSWSLLGIVGGVAGKLFQFCTVPFRGFQAGGGQKYNMVDSQDEIAARLGLQDEPSTGPVQTVPGDFPSEDYGVRSIDSLESDRPRMTKRLRTADSWVMVDDEGETESRPTTPRLSERRVPDHARSPSFLPRPVSRAGQSTPSMNRRPSLIPVSRRSAKDRRSLLPTTKSGPLAHAKQRTYSRSSYGSPVMLEDKSVKNKSPLPKESQRLINKVRREEAEDDARMRRMSSQMSAMLREAKEALGSKFEIEEFDDGEDVNSYNHNTSWGMR